jgi:RHS repeat-associated protein
METSDMSQPAAKVRIGEARSLLSALRAGAPRWAASWLLLVVSAVQAQVPADAYNYTRESSFTYYVATDGAKNGLLKSETIEPSPSNAQLCVTTTYDYDAYGNKSSATTTSCSGATGAAPISARSASSAYAALPAQSMIVNGTTYSPVTAPAGIFVTKATNALNQSETREYDPRFGVVTKLIGPNQLPTTWQLDDFGRKVKEVRVDGTSTITRYCYLSGSVTGTVDETSSNSPNCPVITTGLPELPYFARAFVETVPLDKDGIKMGPFVRVYSDRLGRTIRTVTESFDGSNQTAGRAAALIVQDTGYNATGAKVIQTQPYFVAGGSSTAGGSNDVGVTKTEYDVLGRPAVVSSTDPVGQGGTVSFTSLSNCNTFSYGCYLSRQAAKQTFAYVGLNTIVTNDKLQTRVDEKNPNGQIVRVSDHNKAQVAYQHDAFGNLLITKDALQNQITVTYDIRGRKTQMNDPDNGVWGYCYDALGQLVSQQNSKMRGNGAPGACPAAPSTGTTANAVAGWTTFAYDKLGRMTSRAEPEFVSTWSYDTYANGSACATGIGKLCESNTTNGINKKVYYDGLGRPTNTRTSTTNGVSAGPSFASVVTYDPKTGRVDSQTYPTGLKVGYTYTAGAAKGYLEKLTLLTPATVNPLPNAAVNGTRAPSQSLPANTTLWQAKVVNAWGKTEQQAYGGGVVATQAVFEAATGRTIDLQAGANNTVLNQHYSWDSLNNLTARIDRNGAGDAREVSETFNYDDGLNRLTKYMVSASGIPGLSRTVSLQYNALGMLLSKSDVGDYTYGTQGAGAVRPHALQSVVGAVNTSYSFDANGNVTGSSGNTKYNALAYTSFNLPDSQGGVAGSSNGGTRYTWVYDESHARIKEVRTITSGTYAGTRITWNLHPDNQGGLGFESEVNSPTNPNGSNVSGTSNRHYLSAGGQVIGVMVTTGALPTLAAGDKAPPVIASIVAVKLEYWFKDHLGSLITTTDHSGSVTQRYAYDPFGKRRYTNGSYDPFGNVVVEWSGGVNYGTERGFTGHEGLDDVGLVHMNGRIFDPTLGAFLQGDPLIQDALNLQNYNRYGYCYNNPLTCTDPSGYGFADFLKWIDPLGYAVHKAATKTAFGRAWIQYEIAVGSAWCGPWFAACYGAGQAVNASLAGFSNSQAIKAGFIAGATAYANWYVGTNYTGFFENVAAHAVVGCASSAASGGSCRSGAAGAALGSAWDMSGYQSSNTVIGLVQSTAIGGIASLASGGTFASGATQAAYSYLFNCLSHPDTCTKADQPEIRQAAANCGGDMACIQRIAVYARESGIPLPPDMGQALSDFIKLGVAGGAALTVAMAPATETFAAMTTDQLKGVIGNEGVIALRQLFGSGVPGAQAALVNPVVPSGLTIDAAMAYREIAMRNAGQLVQQIRVQIIDKVVPLLTR